MSIQNPDGPRIQQLRKAKGWSQQDLERNSGVSRGTIIRIEGGRSCTGKTLDLVAKKLGVGLAEIALKHPKGRMTVWVLGSWQATPEWPEWRKIEMLIDTINCELIEIGARLVMGKGDMLQRLADDYFKKLRDAAVKKKFVPAAVMLFGYLRENDLKRVFVEAIGCIPELAVLIGGNVLKGRVDKEYHAAEEAGIPILCVKPTQGCAQQFQSTVKDIPSDVLGVIHQAGEAVDWGKLGESVRRVIRIYAERKAMEIAGVERAEKGRGTEGRLAGVESSSPQPMVSDCG